MRVDPPKKLDSISIGQPRYIVTLTVNNFFIVYFFVPAHAWGSRTLAQVEAPILLIVKLLSNLVCGDHVSGFSAPCTMNVRNWN